jgi:hypothetical protein
MRPSLLLAALVLAGAAQAGLAAPEPMSDADLAGVRGGLMTPLGIEVGFSAQVRTYVDGQLALETQMTWTDQGAVAKRSGALAAEGVPGLPAGIWSAMLPGIGSGTTEIVQDFSDGRVASMVLNSASNRTIRQDIDIQLAIPQLATLEQQAATARLALQLQNATALALSGAASAHH